MKRLRTTMLLTAMLGLLIQCRPVPRMEFPGRQERPKPLFSQIDPVIEDEIKEGNFPGAVVLVGRQDDILYWRAFGHQIIEPVLEPTGKDTIFDLASLTKPIATATSILILKDRGMIDLNDYVGAYLPAFACNGKQEVRIKHLLSHTSGLPAYTNANALKEQFGTPCPEKVIEKICSLEAVNKPGEKFRYSCLGYITLANIVETVSGKSLDDFSKQNIFAPLGMTHTTFSPPDSWQNNIAAAETTDGRPLRGTVHDPLARLMAGVSGNAGLFSNVYDLSIFCRMLLNGGTYKSKRILNSESVRLLTTEQVFGRAYGFDVSSSYSWVKGACAADEAFCHTGYTGTSIVCDPAGGIFVIILANRTHPKDDGTTKPVRTKVADIVFCYLADMTQSNGGEP